MHVISSICNVITSFVEKRHILSFKLSCGILYLKDISRKCRITTRKHNIHRVKFLRWIITHCDVEYLSNPVESMFCPCRVHVYKKKDLLKKIPVLYYFVITYHNCVYNNFPLCFFRAWGWVGEIIVSNKCRL